MSAGIDIDLVRRVRQRLTDSGEPPTHHAVIEAIRAEPGQAALGGATLLRIGDRVFEEVAGVGPLSTLLDDPAVTDVLVNGPGEVWVDHGAGLQPARGIRFTDAAELRGLAQRLAAAAGRRLDDASPCVDVRLPDGSRLHAVLPPLAVGGPYLSIRTLRRQSYGLGDLVRAGTLTPGSAQLVEAIVGARLAFVVTGGTASGKTTVLSAMLSLVPGSERIVIVEDATELAPNHPHVISLQARPPNVEGSGEVGLRDLVRQALRMRPDRLIVGECRGAEVVDWLSALNTGHDGGAGTVHANSADDVPARFEALGLLGGISRDALHAQLAAGLQVVLHLGRRGTLRSLDEVCVLDRTAAAVTAVPAWRRVDGAGPAAEALARLLAGRAISAPSVLFGCRPS
jgi:pilus assembly protein CpaF